MKNKNTIWILLLVLVVLIGGASALYSKLGENAAPEQLAVESENEQNDDGDEENEEEGGEEDSEEALAPDFTVYDADGSEARLSDYTGKPIVLNFWASWCGPCKMEMPDFQEKYLELGEDVHFLMVNMTDGSRETKESAQKFIEENEYTFPVFFDTAYDAAMTYGVYSLPTTLFIDAGGYVVAHASGALDAETLQRGIDMILPAE